MAQSTVVNPRSPVCRRAAVLAVLGLLLLGGPVVAAEPCPFAGQAPKLLVRLYLGQSVPGGGMVSRRAWERFVAEVVTASLPGGFTVLEGRGQWRDPAGAIGREATTVLEVVEDDTPDFRARVARLRTAYQTRFAQRSVGVASTPVCAAF